MPDQSLGVAKSAAVDVPPEVAAAAAGVIGTVSVYVTPHNLGSGGTG